MANPIGQLRAVAPRVFGDALRGVGWIADRLDRTGEAPAEPDADAGPGLAASAWAMAKVAGAIAGAPLTVPALAMAARRTANDCAQRIEAYPEHLLALAEDRPSNLPAPRCAYLDGRQRWLITSDLHRCTGGRNDWPQRQGTKDLYARMLDHYACDGWGLIENGDVEDLWMVGGSTWGAVYDIARTAGGVAAVLDDSIRNEVFAEQIERIVDNNESIYGVIRDGFSRPGRYHRTIGNHDEALANAAVSLRLEARLPGVDPVDSIILLADPNAPEQNIANVMAVVSHGHLTDSWNGPGYSPLGRAVTWLTMGLEDLPAASAAEGLPEQEMVGRLLTGRGRNRLITLDPRFGGNRRFDSLDEERLFAILHDSAPAQPWPWLVFGHTHYPMLRPLNAAGEQVRYANSGSGIMDHTVSALEWDPDRGECPLRLVLWREQDGTVERAELVADGNHLRLANE